MEVKMASPRCVLCLVLALFLPAVSAVVRFTRQPVNVTLKEGATLASISCTVTELDGTTQIVAFEREHHVISDGTHVRHQILESAGLNSQKYRTTISQNADTGSIEYNLNVYYPTRNDSSRFLCVVCQADTSEPGKRLCNANHKFATSDEVTLTVHYQSADEFPVCTYLGPTPAAAPNDSSLVLTEGKPAEFTCTSEIASPPVQLEWTREDTESTEKDQVEVSDKEDLRESKLTLTPSKQDNGTVLVCTLTSSAFNETERYCSMPPLTITPKSTDDKPPDGPLSGTNILIFIVLAVIVVLLIVAIVAALFMRRKRSQESHGHKIEYQPAETGDAELSLETHRDLR